MKTRNIIALILLALALALAVWAYVVLPDTVTTQITASGGTATTMPKLLALIIPVALGAGGAAVCLMNKSDAKAKNKGLIIAAVSVAIMALTLIVNM